MSLDLSQKAKLTETDETSVFDVSTMEAVYTVICRVECLKGEWKSAIKDMQPETFQRLKTSTIMTAALHASTLDGYPLTKKEIELTYQTLKKSKTFENPSHAYAAGYMEGLEFILGSFETLELDDPLIRKIHERILRYTPLEMYRKGQYGFAGKTQSNILAILTGKTPSSAVQTQMQNLIAWYTLKIQEKTKHPLVLIAIFISRYLKLAPFRDGNIPSLRLLTYFLLLKEGYAFASISPLEPMMEAPQKSFPDFKSRLFDFLETIEKQAGCGLETEKETSIEHLLSQKQLALWQWANENKSQNFSRKDAVTALGFPERTVEEIIKKLNLLNVLQRIGQGKSTRYRVV